MYQPLSFRNSQHPNYVYLLKKYLYDLKQASCAWYQHIIEFVVTLGFSNSVYDPSLFIYHSKNDTFYILLYVDDIILTASLDTLHQSIMSKSSFEFAMKDFDLLNYFLSISIIRHAYDIFTLQHKYVKEIIKQVVMSSCKTIFISVVTKTKLSEPHVIHIMVPLNIEVMSEHCNI